MVCIGTGPGPKNVFAESVDGMKVIVPYAIWKFKLKEEQMADDAIYGSAAGFIQFDVEEREANGATVRDATIRSIATGDLLRITIWPEHAETDLEKGDFIAVDGKVTIREVEDKTYVNMSAFGLVKLSPEAREESERVVKKSSAKSTGRKTF